MAATAGLPFLRPPGRRGARSRRRATRPRPPSLQATRVALIERLRRVDEPVLDTLLLSSLSPELGPDDVAAALRRTSTDAAQRWSTSPGPAG